MESRFNATGEDLPVQEFDADGKLPLRTTLVKTFLLIALFCLLPLLAIPLIPDRAAAAVVAVMGGTFALVMLLVAGIMKWMFARFRKGLDKLAAGEHLAHWKIDQPTWDKFIEHERRSADKVPLWVAIGFGVFGLIVVCIIVFTRKSPFGLDSVLWILGVTAGLMVVGWLVGKVVAWCMHQRCDYLSRHVGVVLISGEAVYLTGEYRPIRGFGQRFEGVTLQAKENDLNLLVFVFLVKAKDGYSRQEMRIPVPEGQKEQAVGIVRAFGHG